MAKTENRTAFDAVNNTSIKMNNIQMYILLSVSL